MVSPDVETGPVAVNDTGCVSAQSVWLGADEVGKSGPHPIGPNHDPGSDPEDAAVIVF
jgi:hypothetical protein